MEGLKTRTSPEFKYSPEETKEMIDSLNKTVALQRELGLGDPSDYYAAMLTDANDSLTIKELDKFVQDGMFRWVHEPSESLFPRFTPHNNVKFSSVPEFVMLKLDKGLKAVNCNAAGSNYKANIPVIPMAALELTKRVKEKAPGVDLYLLFQPSWEKQPQGDPVLLAHVSDDYFLEVASWDSDGEMISQLLVDRSK